MYYILQDNTFNEEGYDRLIAAFERLDLNYEVTKVLPFVEYIEFQTSRKDVFVFGSIKLCRLAAKYSWIPGAYTMGLQHMESCKKRYSEMMLNDDSISLYAPQLAMVDDESLFIRPMEDNKLFKGGLYSGYEWKKTLETIQNPEEHIILVAAPKKIFLETRFWVVGNEIVTASSYKVGRQTNYNIPVDQAQTAFCRKAIDRFKPAPAFVIDICLCDSGYKIVECGCMNAAGFYSADMQKLLIALEEYHKEEK